MLRTQSVSQVAQDVNISDTSVDQGEQNFHKDDTRILDKYGNEFILPDYTISQVRAAIPRHCYERSAIKSLSYLMRDIASIAVTFMIFNSLATEVRVPWIPARFLLHVFYVLIQSLNMTGLWVLGHECGHQAFSASGVLNDTVGFILHSALLVPYFSWKISHGKHHKATNNMHRDMGFVPETKDQFFARTTLTDLASLSEETPLYTLFSLLKLQFLGWWIYLLTNTTSHNHHSAQKEGRGLGKKDGFWSGVNHFNTGSPIFDNKDTLKVIASNVGILAILTILSYFAHTYTWKAVALHYLLPYILLNNWIILITSLQHSDPSVPHYLPENWTWIRGSAATIDRDFGLVGRFFFHGIIETHVLHHHVPKIPFYHAAEASLAMRGVIGRHYRSDTRGGMVGYFGAVWRRMRELRWVEPSGLGKEYEGVLFYGNYLRNSVSPRD